MSLPENHLDVVNTPGSIDPDAPRPKPALIIGALALPLFFLVSFILAYSSALHAPVPHDMALTIAGPAQTTSQVAAGLAKQAAGGFDITRTTSADAAVRAVEDRSAVGAIVIGSTGSGASATPTVEVVVASGGGLIAAGTVRQVGTAIGQQLQATPTVRDVAPLWTEDGSGTGLFYYTLLCTIGGFLTITVLFQVLPHARRRTKLLTAVAAAVAAPLIAFAAMALSLGAYGMDFGHLAAVIGVAMLYTLVVGLFALLATELLGQAAIFAVVLCCVVLNFPSSGGSAPESVLPAFWQAVHAVWFGSGALESFRSFVYFGGDGFGWPFTRLLIWLAGLVLGLAALYLLRRRRGTDGGQAEDAAPSEAERSGSAAVAVAV